MRRVPEGTRIVVDPMGPDEWRVVVPGRATRPLMFLALACLAWIAGWAVGEVFALRAFFARDRDPGFDWPVLLWVVGWTAGGVAGIWSLRKVLGVAFGIEVLLLRSRRTTLIRSLWGIATREVFETGRIRSFEENARWGLRFRIGEQAVRFGLALRPEEREWLLLELRGILATLVKQQGPP